MVEVSRLIVRSIANRAMSPDGPSAIFGNVAVALLSADKWTSMATAKDRARHSHTASPESAPAQ
jgi:hypothetical protein